MSSRVAKPGGTKFRPSRPVPKKSAHPASIAPPPAAGAASPSLLPTDPDVAARSQTPSGSAGDATLQSTSTAVEEPTSSAPAEGRGPSSNRTLKVTDISTSASPAASERPTPDLLYSSGTATTTRADEARSSQPTPARDGSAAPPTVKSATSIVPMLPQFPPPRRPHGSLAPAPRGNPFSTLSSFQDLQSAATRSPGPAHELAASTSEGGAKTTVRRRVALTDPSQSAPPPSGGPQPAASPGDMPTPPPSQTRPTPPSGLSDAFGAAALPTYIEPFFAPPSTRSPRALDRSLAGLPPPRRTQRDGAQQLDGGEQDETAIDPALLREIQAHVSSVDVAVTQPADSRAGSRDARGCALEEAASLEPSRKLGGQVKAVAKRRPRKQNRTAALLAKHHPSDIPVPAQYATTDAEAGLSSENEPARASLSPPSGTIAETASETGKKASAARKRKAQPSKPRKKASKGADSTAEEVAGATDASELPVDGGTGWQGRDRVGPLDEQVGKRKRKRASPKDAIGSNGQHDGAESADATTVEPWQIAKKKHTYVLSVMDILTAMDLPQPEAPDFVTAQDVPVTSGRGGKVQKSSTKNRTKKPGEKSLRGSMGQAASDAESAAMSRRDSQRSGADRSDLDDLIDPSLREDEGAYASGGREQQDGDQEEYEERRQGQVEEDDEAREPPEEDYEDEADEEPHTVHDDPSAPLDPTTTTMKSLVRDTGRGRISSKMSDRIEARNARSRHLKKMRERMKLRVAYKSQGLSDEAIERLLDGEDADGESRQAEEEVDQNTNGQQPGYGSDHDFDSNTDRGEAEGSVAPSAHAESEMGEGVEEDGLVESQFAPQMKLVNGELVLDQETLQIEQTNNFDSFATVEDRAEDKRVNSSTYSKRQRTARWTTKDTKLFYDGLRQFGTDFELIAGMFRGRTRRQIKLKWVREERMYPEKINEALSKEARLPVNMELYMQASQLDLDGPVPADPMSRYYENLPAGERSKLESNREVDLEAKDVDEEAEEGHEHGEGLEEQEGIEEGKDTQNRPLFHPDSDNEDADDNLAAYPASLQPVGADHDISEHDTQDENLDQMDLENEERPGEDDTIDYTDEGDQDDVAEAGEPSTASAAAPAPAFDFAAMGGVRIGSRRG